MAKNQKSSKSLLFIIIVVILVILAVKMLGGGAAPASDISQDYEDDEKYSYYVPGFASYNDHWTASSNSSGSIVADNHADGIRDKFTSIRGGGKDTVTIMVYMCGTDLESQASMASYDLSEMANASFGDNVNIIVYTGGCSKWHINGISTKKNQIYQLKDGGMTCLVDNAGTTSMVDPDNLVSFIEFCGEHFPADRKELIFWDHGGGTVSGYGYDEKNPGAGSMTLEKIDQALTEADVKFDFVGFDACLMATAETGLMLAEHADYMIASEESEPGIGWYYTDWLTALGRNTSMATTEIGKNIADSFVSKCQSDTPSQPATLSVVDLAELEYALPSKLAAFAESTTEIINDGGYRTVSSARGSSREFGASSGVDMVDLTDLASRMGTEEGNALKETLLSCIKYNKASRSMTNSYGLSIFFPYRSTQYVNQVLRTYDNIDMDSDYADCIKSFASYQTSGQLSSGGSHNAYSSFGSYDGGSYYSQQSSADGILDLLSLFMGGGYTSNDSYSNYYSSGTDSWYSDYFGYGGSSLFGRSMAGYVADNHFDADLNWKNGKILLTKDQWSMVSDLKLNMFIDDGEGYIDLGTDNIYDIDDSGSLLKQEDLTWVAASADGENWQIVPFYYESSFTSGDQTVTAGRIPVLLNDIPANLLVQFDDAGMEVVGAAYTYKDNDIAAKNLTGLNAGDELKFVCDYYDYNGKFTDTYVLGEKLTVGDKLYLGDASLDGYKTLASYEIVDIYRQSYWTPEM